MLPGVENNSNSECDGSDDSSGGWEEMISDELDLVQYKCFSCPEILRDPDEFFGHVAMQHDWPNVLSDLISSQLRDQYDWIRFVNFVRKNPQSDLRNIFMNSIWNNESTDLLLPVIPDDHVLSIDIESYLSADKSRTIVNAHQCTANNFTDDEKTKALITETETLREQLNVCKNLLARFANQQPVELNSHKESKINVHSCVDNHEEEKSLVHKLDSCMDDAYFQSYGHFGIHGEMITDRVRTESYRNFILSNAKIYFKDKVVLDIGAGSGILSMFAAEAGAKHVYGVEASMEIFAAAKESVRVNNLENQITLLHDRVESVLLPVKQVDVIVSEWMGYFLFYESMLNSVLYAAKHYLPNSTGRIFPRHYILNLIGVQCNPALRTKYLDHWSNVYGYAMPALRRSALTEAHILDLTGKSDDCDLNKPVRILTRQPFKICELDLQQVIRSGQSNCQWSYLGEKPFTLFIDEQSIPAGDSAYLDALVGFFDVRFDDDAPVQVQFSTSPDATYTHWKQTLFFLDKPILVHPSDRIEGILKISRAQSDHRGLEIALTLNSSHGTSTAIQQNYLLVS